MDFTFDQFVEIGIKRLTRPKFRHALPTFNDPTLFGEQLDITNTPNQNFNELEHEGLHANDISYDKVESSDMALAYASDFYKKQACGERFNVLLTILNSSNTHTLEYVRLKVTLIRYEKETNKKAN